MRRATSDGAADGPAAGHPPSRRRSGADAPPAAFFTLPNPPSFVIGPCPATETTKNIRREREW